MTRRTATAALTTAVLTLAAAPSAFARTDQVGDAGHPATDNICVAQIACTYVNYKDGHPADTVRHAGTLRSWTVGAASPGGTVRLRILRPAGHGRLRFAAASGPKTVASDGPNTFTSSIHVHRGDVLALSNDTSGLYMNRVEAGREVRYFNYDQPQHTGAAGTPSRIVPELHVLLSAKIMR